MANQPVAKTGAKTTQCTRGSHPSFSPDVLDILENAILERDPELLNLLLKDKTTNKNILWCTTDYVANGPGFGERDEMTVESVTKRHGKVIQPRSAKSLKIQTLRAREKGEVFTPSWVCNAQNNQVDEGWFGRPDVFNTPDGMTWKRSRGSIQFGGTGKTWQEYVSTPRLEISCGEAPYLVSRYDTTTGKPIDLYDRIGLLDRKMRVVSENCKHTKKEWIDWSVNAVKSVYGFEFQGDSVMVARENLLFSYVDYYLQRFGVQPPRKLLQRITNIVAWNIWQMDGLKCVVPYSCGLRPDPSTLPGMEPKMVPCAGCLKHTLTGHNGTPCRIYDWQATRPHPILFTSTWNTEKIK